MHGKVYDCFTFFNELDLLELRLETLNDYVDYFVISESDTTYSGQPKDLYYLRNKERFSKFSHKIIHQVITDTPVRGQLFKYDDGTKDMYYQLVINRLEASRFYEWQWIREFFEKESLIRPLTFAEKDDIIILSDVDEIVKPEALMRALENFNTEKAYYFEQEVFYYYLNLQKNEPWKGSMAVSFRRLLTDSYNSMRSNKTGIFVPNGGWHFTFQNGKEQIRKKLEAYSHQEFNNDSVKNNIDSSITNAIQSGRDLLGRPCSFTQRNIEDGTFPEYLVKHKHDIFKDMIV